MLYVAIPFHLALDPDGSAFGLLLDATHRSAFDLAAMDRSILTMTVEDEHMDWFYLHGPDPATVVRRLGDLVGRIPMPPRWALGYHQARWSYASDEEARSVAAALRHHRFPADVIHLDIDHMDGFRDFTWDHDRFPDPERLIGDLRAMGLRTTVVVDSAVKQDPADSVYLAGHTRGFFVRSGVDPASEEYTAYQWAGRSVLPDQTRPEVRRWWGGLYRYYLDVGVAGFLNDMNEPALHDRPFDEAGSANTEPPPDTPFGSPEEGLTHAEVRNAYATLEDEATFEALRASRPRDRPFLVTRSGGTGVARYATVWTGDNASLWEHLEMSVPQLLNLGLSGVPLAGADIGGFFDDCSAELLVRWMQLGAFYPFARNNSARDTVRQEPWAWGGLTLWRCRRAMRFRYRLLPYLYTLTEVAHTSGLPILRPLFLEFPEDPRAHAIDDELMVGRDLLVAPILRPGRMERAVYLPAGTSWLDLRVGRWHTGGQSLLVTAGLDERVPIFIRGGSIVPLAPAMDWSEERPVDPLTLLIALGDDGEAAGSLYEDDGWSTRFEEGDVRHTIVRAHTISRGTEVGCQRQGSFRPPDRRARLVVHGPGGPRRRVVIADDPGDWDLLIR
jgi:alpha-glucosidase